MRRSNKEIIILTIILITIMLLAGCGPHDVRVSGEVELKHNIDYSALIDYVESICNYDKECIRNTLGNIRFEQL